MLRPIQSKSLQQAVAGSSAGNGEHALSHPPTPCHGAKGAACDHMCHDTLPGAGQVAGIVLAFACLAYTTESMQRVSVVVMGVCLSEPSVTCIGAQMP
jgi:hypothetical protein